MHAPSRSTPKRSKTEEILSAIDWDRLSPEALEIAATLTPLISDGLSRVEISAHFGKPPTWAGDQLRLLRREIEAQLEQPES